MAGQNVKCVSCHTQCLDCRDTGKTRHWQKSRIDKVDNGMMLIPIRLYHDLMATKQLPDEYREELQNWFRDV